MLKGHEVKTGDRIVAWSKEAHRYVAVTVWKVNASSCQGKDKNLELYKGLEYKQCWTVEAFQQQKPDDYNSLFGKKNATQSQQISTDSQTGTGYNPSADSARLGDQQSGHDQQGDSGRNGLDLSDSPQQFQSFGATGEGQERTKKQGETLLSDGDFTVVDELEEPTTAKEIWEEENASRSSNSTYVAESEPDSVGQDYNSDLTSLEPARLTSIVQVSSESDSPQQSTTETLRISTQNLDTTSTNQEPSTFLVPPHPVNPSQSKANDSEQTTSEIVSPQSSSASPLSDHAISVLRMSEDSLAVLSAQDTSQAPISGILSGSYTSAGTMLNGKLSAQPTLEVPGVESDSLLLESPGALSSSGNGRPPGQSKLEVQLKELGALQQEEVCNPAFLEAAYSLPTGWTDPQVHTTAGEFLAAMEQPEIDEPHLETPLTPELQPRHSSASSTSTHSWIDPRSVRSDAGTQSRAWEDSETIDDYAEKMLAGLWDWERQPLPVVFYDGENYYPGDCHHRVKAAIKAEQDSICVDVREGSLRDAIVYSCQANTDHGIPLRPRDQRRRIEMLLEQLAAMSPDERIALLGKAPGVKEQERAHVIKTGEWSSRVIARYLKLTASGYVTVTNVQKEREFKRLVEELGLKEGDRFISKGAVCSIALLSPSSQKVSVSWVNGGIQSISLDEFLTNFTSVEGEPEQSEVLKFNTQSEANQPDLLEELEEESGHKPPQLLPDKERNEGSPLVLAREDGSQPDTAELLLNQLMGQIGLLSDAQLQQLLIKAKAELNRRQEYRRSA